MCKWSLVKFSFLKATVGKSQGTGTTKQDSKHILQIKESAPELRDHMYDIVSLT